MTATMVEDLQAAFGLAHPSASEPALKVGRSLLRRLVDHLAEVGVTELSQIDAATLNGWVAIASDGSALSYGTFVRRLLSTFDPLLLHDSLLIEGRFDWSSHRPATAIWIPGGRPGHRTWIDPAAYPNVRAVAEALCSLLPRIPDHYSDAYRGAFGRAVRSLLRWLDDCAAPPVRLEWLTADLLDGWIGQLKTSAPNHAREYGSRIRDLVANRPVDLEVHASLVAADGLTVVWEPDAARQPVVTEDLPFATVAAIHDAARDQVRRTVARVTTIARVARAATAADAGGDWREPGDVWRVALEGRLDASTLAAGLGDDPAAWPGWLTRLLPEAKPLRRPWPMVAVRAVYEHVFPTALEITAGYVLMLLATGLPPESVMALEHDWFLVARRPDGSYGPVCRLRYSKDRAAGTTQARLYTTRSATSPVRVRDLVVRMTGGLTRLAGEDLAGRLWLVLAPSHLDSGRRPTVTTLNRVQPWCPARRDSAPPFPAWIGSHGIDDPDRIAAWNRSRAARHAARVAEHHRRVARRGPVAGLLGVPPLRPYAVWPGRVAPGRLRKTLRVRDLVLHGPEGAARDHATLTLLRHYTASEALQVVAATAVRDAQATLEAFASDPTPRLIAADDGTPTATLARLLGLDEDAVGRLVADGTTRMRNGLVCTAPGNPPSGQRVGEDGWCRQLGTTVCTSCPAALAVPAGVDGLWGEVRRLDRTAHVTNDNPTVARAAWRYRQLLEAVLEVLDPRQVARYRAGGTVPTTSTGQLPVVPPRRRRT